MSTVSKKYYSPKNPDMFLSVSWETGYRNIQVFHDGRLVHVINQPTVLVKGVKIQDEELGTLKFFFSEARPRKLEIKVNRRRFKTINKLNLSYDYTGLITIFTTLSVLAVCESFVLGGLYEFNFSYPLFSFAFISGFVIAVLYGVTSYLLSKRKSWSFFMGTSMFLLTTLISTISIGMILSSFANFIVLIARYSMLIYMLYQVKHILKEVKRAQISTQEDGLIDSI